MNKKLFLLLILVIFLLNIKKENFTANKKITYGSCWVGSTKISLSNISDNSPRWLKMVKKNKDKEIATNRCERLRKGWARKINEEREKSRKPFQDYLNKYSCQNKDKVLEAIDIKAGYEKIIDYSEKKTKEFKNERITKIKEGIDLIKDIKFISVANNKIMTGLKSILKTGIFDSNNNIRENCTILPGQDKDEVNNLFQ